jgi:hypothetical protein
MLLTMVKTKVFIEPTGSMWVVITFERYGRMGGWCVRYGNYEAIFL